MSETTTEKKNLDIDAVFQKTVCDMRETNLGIGLNPQYILVKLVENFSQLGTNVEIPENWTVVFVVQGDGKSVQTGDILLTNAEKISFTYDNMITINDVEMYLLDVRSVLALLGVPNDKGKKTTPPSPATD